jgi:hypothetical protein
VVDDSPLRGAVEGFCPSDCDKVFYIVGKETGTNVFICTSTMMLIIFSIHFVRHKLKVVKQEHKFTPCLLQWGA